MRPQPARETTVPLICSAFRSAEIFAEVFCNRGLHDAGPAKNNPNRRSQNVVAHHEEDMRPPATHIPMICGDLRNAIALITLCCEDAPKSSCVRKHIFLQRQKNSRGIDEITRGILSLWRYFAHDHFFAVIGKTPPAIFHCGVIGG